MKNSKNRVRLIEVHAKCLKCGTERILYYTSSATYGERIVTTKSGKKCAHVNFFEENIVQELEKYCSEIYWENGISISSSNLKRIVSGIYGITCDELGGEKIDTTPNTKCPSCLGKIVEDDRFGEQLKEIEVFEVTHYSWKILEEDERKEKIRQELIRQEYL